MGGTHRSKGALGIGYQGLPSIHSYDIKKSHLPVRLLLCAPPVCTLPCRDFHVLRQGSSLHHLRNMGAPTLLTDTELAVIHRHFQSELPSSHPFTKLKKEAC